MIRSDHRDRLGGPLDDRPWTDELLDWGDHGLIEGSEQLGDVAVAIDRQESAERRPGVDFGWQRNVTLNP